MSYNLRECREVCADGTYWEYDNNGSGDGSGVNGSGGKCVDCGEGCAKCVNKDTCLECEEGYELKDGKCEAGNVCPGLPKEYFMLINVNGKKVCVTKRNMGDGAGWLDIPSSAGVTSVGVGGSCDSATKKCCWKVPSQSCDSGSSSGMCSYSGCGRTVCNWNAGDAICKSFKAGGKDWTLPTDDVIRQLYNYTANKGDSGLCLCDSDSSTFAPRCNWIENGCSGSLDGYCYPFNIWGSYSSGSNARYYHLGFVNLFGPATDMRDAYSVRCTTKL